MAEGGSVEYIEIQVSSLQNERDIMIFCDRYIRAFKGEIIDFCTFIEMPPERTKDFIAILAVFAVKKIQQIVSRALEQKVMPVRFRIETRHDHGKKLEITYTPFDSRNKPLLAYKKITEFKIIQDTFMQPRDFPEFPGPNQDSGLN